MNAAKANASVMEPAGAPPGGMQPPDNDWPAAPQSDGGWSGKKMIFLITLALIIHVALIVAFGTKKQFVPKSVTPAPRLELADRDNELVELANPALFALPNPRDFAAAVWQQTPVIAPPSFRWKAAPGEKAQPDPDALGDTFTRFMQTNQIGDFHLDFKPPPLFVELSSPAGSVLPQSSLLQISGALAQRTLVVKPALPSLDWNDVIAPSKVQVLVDQTGDVVSAILLPSDNALEAAGRSLKGDTNAIALARSLKFVPAAQLMFGEITFYWHTTPLISTNDADQP